MSTLDTTTSDAAERPARSRDRLSDDALVVENVSKLYPADRRLNTLERTLARLGGVERDDVPLDDDEDGLDELDEPSEEGGAETLALDDVSFTVARGCVLGLVGPPGAGKSTLLGIAGGMSDPTSGRVVVRGRVAPALEAYVRALPPRLTLENAVPFLATMVRLSRSDAKRRLDDIFRFGEVQEYRHQLVSSSTRKRRRQLLLGTMFTVEADVLLVDASLGGTRFREKCLERIEERRSAGAAVVVTARDVESVADFADRVVYLERGRVVAEGEPGEVARLIQVERRQSADSPSLTADATRYIGHLEIAIGVPRTQAATHAAIDAALAARHEHVDWEAIANAVHVPRRDAQAVVDRLRAQATGSLD